MKRFVFALCVALGCLVSGQPIVAGAMAKAKPHAQSAKKQTMRVRNKGNRSVSSVKPRVSAERKPQGCVARHGKRHRCKSEELILKSPIKEIDLDRQGVETRDADVKARVVPDRAYAVNGDTFFYQGRKFRISGLSGDDGSEMAKQRLQRALDLGAITLDPLGMDEAGVTTAAVRINGKSLVEQMPSP